MAENKLLTVPLGNNITDEQLKDVWDAEGRAGIARNEVAYSNRLNTILRQVTLITNAVADMYVEKMNAPVDSDENSMTSAKLLSLINALVLDLSWNKNTAQVANSFWAGPVSGVNATPAFRKLVATDIPNLDAAKITSGELPTERIAPSAITEDKLNANVLALINRMILDLSWNKNTEQVANSVWAGPVSGVASKPAFRKLNAADIPNLNAAKITDGTLPTERIADKAITKAKLNTDVFTGGYIVDALISPIHSSVVGKVGNSESLASYTVRKLTQAQYNAIAVKDPNTLYFIVG